MVNNFFDWARRNRNPSVIRALTVLRSYVRAIDDGLTRVVDDGTLDDDRQNLYSIQLGLAMLDDKRRGMTAREVVQRIFPQRERNEPYPNDGFDDLREAIECVTHCTPGRTPDAFRFGKYLSKNRGRVLLGRKVDRVTVDSDSNVIRWAVSEAHAGVHASVS